MRAKNRVVEWFGLAGTLKIFWFQPPCHQQGHLPPAQAAQSSTQPGLQEESKAEREEEKNPARGKFSQ